MRSPTWSFIKQGPGALQVGVKKNDWKRLAGEKDIKPQTTPALVGIQRKQLRGKLRASLCLLCQKGRWGRQNVAGSYCARNSNGRHVFTSALVWWSSGRSCLFFMWKHADVQHLSWKGRESQLSLVWCLERRRRWLTNLSLLKVPEGPLSFSFCFVQLFCPSFTFLSNMSSLLPGLISWTYLDRLSPVRDTSPLSLPPPLPSPASQCAKRVQENFMYKWSACIPRHVHRQEKTF